MTVFDLRLEWLVTQEYFFNNPVRLQRGDVGEIQTGMCVCVCQQASHDVQTLMTRPQMDAMDPFPAETSLQSD